MRVLKEGFGELAPPTEDPLALARIVRDQLVASRAVAVRMQENMDRLYNEAENVRVILSQVADDVTTPLSAMARSVVERVQVARFGLPS